ncbi:multidrug transporter subunit MdtA [Pseudoxanthomonas jiangsuensis]|uniref:MdtA/MuxA family multidrug efflux RND transporter periplasmic adaptor subunit n=1 Tax=Pseudoxanthomonas jiangsuensis TaxID=619688 RepID=UPI0013910276|nr:MdtA/MuxA family multidrug efflux RND transporter periplasmic adaptor subunit [Pseudoxanthomonas jiangsuensis]KAF1691615.1 multidrug transporter subunit MdtA [Pseudoxanthomonas jiangsuensis]
MTRLPRFAKPLAVIVLLAAIVLGWRACSGGKEDGGDGRWGDGERPPTPVRVAVAERGPLDVELKALGTVTPLRTVTVRSRVEGELLRLAFDEGQQVRAGQLLAEIDPAPFKVQLAQATGQQKQNLAELENTRIQLQRYRDLAGGNYVSAQDVANLQAQVRQFEGRRESDQAAVDEARLQLDYTRILAPIDGRVGLRGVDVGNLVRTGDENGIVTLTQTRPISVVFALPETALGSLTAAVRGGGELAVQAWDRDERRPLATGTLSSIDNRIDTQTGTVRLRAVFANDDESLFPNQSVNVRLRLGREEAIVVPEAAVQFGSQGTYVYVVNADATAAVRPVKLGASQGERVAVAEGLKPGERVVLEGLDRLREGGKVEVIGDGADAAGEAGKDDDTTTAADGKDAARPANAR